MKILPPQLIIDENAPFKNDILDRQFFGENLLKVISKTNEHLVISIDGKWGEGKTTFVKMWQGLLNQKKINNIYFDAFANDYFNDAFISLVSVITSFADENIKTDEKDTLDKFKKKTKDIASKTTSISIKLAIKALSMGIIKNSDIEELKDIKNDISKEFSELVGGVIDEKLSSHKKDIEDIELFKELLSKLPENLNDSENSPLVIIIDELDRCKPTFAVELIEKIKHLFSVENIIFVLVMNKQHLEESIKSVYGQNIDSHTYLQKFITIETQLPKETNTKLRAMHDYSKYTNHLLNYYELITFNIEENIIYLAEFFDLSLRQLEKTVINLAFFYLAIPEQNMLIRQRELIAFLAVLKVINPNIYKQTYKGKISYQDLCKEINLYQLTDKPTSEQAYLEPLTKWLAYSMITNDNTLQKIIGDEALYFQARSQYIDIERDKIIPEISKYMNIFSKTY